MGFKVGCVSQKGGVGKSTLARAIGAAYAKADWNVKVADLDISQSTSFDWLQRRLEAEINPYVAVECFGTIAQALRVADNYDLMVFDGGPKATKTTVEIAKAVDLLVLPTGLSLDDMKPTVQLANTLVEKHSIPADRISLAICRAGDSQIELAESTDYLKATQYYLYQTPMFEKTSYRRAQDNGYSAIETPNKSTRTQADKLVQEIIDRLEELTN